LFKPVWGGVVLKNIVIFTMGTRGDIQPYIYLAQALIKQGNKVEIGTHPCWEKLVTSSMVEFIPIGPDIDIEYEAAVIRGRTKNPLFSMLKTMKFVFNIIENSSKDIYESCKNKDIVIVSHSQMGATEAEALGIETVNVTLQSEMIPEVKKKKNLRDKVFAALINPQMVKPYNKIRKLYSLQKVKSMDEVMSPKLNLIPISRYIVEQNPYWDERNKIVGYWYSDDDSYQPDEKLKVFLCEGNKPIILALGAMSFESKKEKEKLDIFVDAFQKTGMRAIIQGFNKTLTDYKLPETMISVGSVPHSWLFKQGYCVIHHCGFGTSASSLLYGIPTIPVPHVLDQFAFAEHLYKLKVSVKPIKASVLSVEKLTSAINELKANYSEIHDRVEDLAKKMQEENGLENAVKLIESAADDDYSYKIHHLI
jgi:UDP:flavonoid glycosyltransferase YjiC (YdhE family)